MLLDAEQAMVVQPAAASPPDGGMPSSLSVRGLEVGFARPRTGPRVAEAVARFWAITMVNRSFAQTGRPTSRPHGVVTSKTGPSAPQRKQTPSLAELIETGLLIHSSCRIEVRRVSEVAPLQVGRGCTRIGVRSGTGCEGSRRVEAFFPGRVQLLPPLVPSFTIATRRPPAS